MIQNRAISRIWVMLSRLGVISELSFNFSPFPSCLILSLHFPSLLMHPFPSHYICLFHSLPLSFCPIPSCPILSRIACPAPALFLPLLCYSLPSYPIPSFHSPFCCVPSFFFPHFPCHFLSFSHSLRFSSLFCPVPSLFTIFS